MDILRGTPGLQTVARELESRLLWCLLMGSSDVFQHFLLFEKKLPVIFLLLGSLEELPL